jgi:hypothetical protein
MGVMPRVLNDNLDSPCDVLKARVGVLNARVLNAREGVLNAREGVLNGGYSEETALAETIHLLSQMEIHTDWRYSAAVRFGMERGLSRDLAERIAKYLHVAT